METFNIIIASTNLVEGLDAAALRRFDLKAKFDYLKPAQAGALLAAHLAASGRPPAQVDEWARLAALENLTPGDYAAVARQHRFRPLLAAASWVAALETECRQKPAFRRHIAGFSSIPKAS